MLGVPRRLELLRGAADRQRVRTVRVTVTIAVVGTKTSVTRRPHVDDALSTATLISEHISYLFTDDVMEVGLPSLYKQ